MYSNTYDGAFYENNFNRKLTLTVNVWQSHKYASGLINMSNATVTHLEGLPYYQRHEIDMLL